MPTHDPAALDSSALARRLHELAGDERKIQVEFLLHLDEFDRRQAYVPAGFGSLWDYCLKELHLREGAAGRRIGAMRVLRRFPALEGPLRDGRLCLSTVSQLGQVLTEENLEEMVSRAAFLTKSEVEHLVVSIRPKIAPRDGIRAIPGAALARSASPATALALPDMAGDATTGADGSLATQPVDAAELSGGLADAAKSTTTEQVPEGARAEQAGAGATPPAGESADRRPTRRAEIQAVSHDQWSLRVTLDASLKSDLESLTSLLSHKIPTGELAEVLREAVRCAIEKHGKRRGAVVPERSHPSAAPGRHEPVERRPGTPFAGAPTPPGSGTANDVPMSAGSSMVEPAAQHALATPQHAAPPAARVAPIGRWSRTIPMAVRRAVWNRDGGRCTFESEDGHRCESTWQLELDHVDSAALGGEPTAKNLRLRCRSHNFHHAEEVFGREYMARFRRPWRGSSGVQRRPGGVRETSPPG